jgi:hypothetical protein
MIPRINSQSELAELAVQFGTRPDWHEPDEQGLTAHVFGFSFDNAGSWGQAAQHMTEASRELWVRLYKDNVPVADVNLATLFSWAARDETRAERTPQTGQSPGVRRLRRTAEQEWGRVHVHTELAAHDGLAPHSHEVRPDHLGVALDSPGHRVRISQGE